MRHHGTLIICDRCGEYHFCKTEDPAPTEWRLIAAPGKSNDYREMVEVCPQCFAEYCKMMDKYYANTNVKKDES